MDQHDGAGAAAIELDEVLAVGGDDPSVRGARAGGMALAASAEEGASVHESSVGFGGRNAPCPGSGR